MDNCPVRLSTNERILIFTYSPVKKETFCFIEGDGARELQVPCINDVHYRVL